MTDRTGVPERLFGSDDSHHRGDSGRDTSNACCSVLFLPTDGERDP